MHPRVQVSASGTNHFDLRLIAQYGTHGKRERGWAGGFGDTPWILMAVAFRICPTFGMRTLVNAGGG
jgi:hypothetical protein